MTLRLELVVVVRRRLRKTGEWTAKRTYVLPRGDYLYVGSAHGPGGLPSRVGRHLSVKERRRWDIDFLLSNLPQRGLKAWGLPSPSSTGLECRWAEAIFNVDGTSPVLGTLGTSVRRVHGFGAGDCRLNCGCSIDSPRTCRTHLFRVCWQPTHERLREILAPNLKDLRKEYNL